jgi:hypothetical protein
MVKFNTKTAKCAFDFNKGSMTLLTTSGEEPIVSYTSSYKGRDYFSVRKLYSQDEGDTWNPGKGISIPATQAAEFCKAVAGLSTPKAVKAKTRRAS